jgi:hypothetical protein
LYSKDLDFTLQTIVHHLVVPGKTAAIKKRGRARLKQNQKVRGQKRKIPKRYQRRKRIDNGIICLSELYTNRKASPIDETPFFDTI